MKQFVFSDHFRLREDDTFLGVVPIQPKSTGINLIIQYLDNKYNAKICYPVYSYIFNSSTKEPEPSYTLNHTAYDLEGYIHLARNQPGDYRQAFVIGMGHAVFMTYIKEKDREAILCSDSIDTDATVIEFLRKKMGIPIFTNVSLSGRQADGTSCYLDGIVLGRDTTAVDPQTGEYRIKNLISLLEKRVVTAKDMISYVKLPNQLLKTAQRRGFVDLHRDHDPGIYVHKGLNLDEFRAHYQKKGHSIYLQQKGIKYSKIAEIQFYLNQMELEAGFVLSNAQKNEFIRAAKEIFKNKQQQGLHAFAEDFLKRLLQQSESQRPAQQFKFFIPEEKNNFGLMKAYTFEIKYWFDVMHWSTIAKKGDLIKAKALLDDAWGISQLANSRNLWKCADTDAYFAIELLNRYPHYLTESETQALKWRATYYAHKSQLYEQSLLEHKRVSPQDEPLTSIALENETHSEFKLESLEPNLKGTFFSRTAGGNNRSMTHVTNQEISKAKSCWAKVSQSLCCCSPIFSKMSNLEKREQKPTPKYTKIHT